MEGIRIAQLSARAIDDVVVIGTKAQSPTLNAN